MKPLDLEKIGRQYRYSPPKKVARVPLGVKWGQLRGDVRRQLEEVFLREGGLAFRSRNTLLVNSEVPNETEEEINLSVGFCPWPKDPTERLELTLGQDEMGSTAELWWKDLDTTRWSNVHRLTDPRFEGQGLLSELLQFSELCARTQAFVRREVHEFVFEELYQLDVLNFLLKRGYVPEDPSQLDRLQSQDSGLRIQTYEYGNSRPWSVFEGKRLYDIPLVKTFPPVRPLAELRRVNGTF